MRKKIKTNGLLSLPVLLVLALVLVAGAAAGQTTGDIQGTITDSTGAALPGVTVEASSPNLQGLRSAVTGNSGAYRISSVPPGTYRVRASLSGFQGVEKTAIVSLDGTATVNLTMQITAQEDVVVSGEAPVVDTATTTIGSNYSAKVMERLPVERNFASVVRSQPGVQEDSGDRQGRGLALSVYGSTSAENQYVIDGINTNSVVRGVQGKIINTEFIQEVEVKTGGYQAEYGRATGGIINVITKSGGNEFHGDVFGNYSAPGFRNEQQSVLNNEGDLNDRDSVVDDVETLDYGADLGGYFVKDRIWFFGAYNRSDGERNRIPQGGTVRGQRFLEEHNYNLLSGKLTFNIAQGSTLVGTYFRDPEHRDGAVYVPLSSDPNSYAGRLDIGSEDYAGRFNQLFGSIGVLTLQYSRHNDRFRFKPLDTSLVSFQDRTRASDNPNWPVTRGFGAVPGYALSNTGERDEYTGSFTAYFGNHELKVGGDFVDQVTISDTYYTGQQQVRVRTCSDSPASSSFCEPGGGASYVNVYGEPLRVYFEHRYYSEALGSINPVPVATSAPPTQMYSAFLQDTWRVTPKFSLNAGIRYDVQKVQNALEDTVIDLDNQWQPRLGFVYDWKGDGSTKLFGSYGRFYYVVPNDLNVRVYGGEFITAVYNYSETSLVHGGPPNRDPLFQGAANEPVDDGIEGQYQDEFTLGVEMALAPTFAVGVKGMYRELGRAIEDRCDLDYTDPVNNGSSCAIVNPGASGFWGTGGDFGWCDAAGSAFVSATAGECFATGAPDIPEANRVFKGVELTARKSFTRDLWLQASYLYSTLRGNYDGAVRVASGQTDPGINADYDYPAFSDNADGRLFLDRPHQFRVDSVYTSPFGLSVGVGAYYRSGAPVSRYGWYNSFYPNLLHLVDRGHDTAISGGRLVAEYEANLSLAYPLTFGRVTVTPALYVFNLLDRQGVLTVNENFNRDGSFCELAEGCTPENTPEYTQRNFDRLGRLAFGDPLPEIIWGTPSLRQSPRELRLGLKVSF